MGGSSSPPAQDPAIAPSSLSTSAALLDRLASGEFSSSGGHASPLVYSGSRAGGAGLWLEPGGGSCSASSSLHGGHAYANLASHAGSLPAVLGSSGALSGGSAGPSRVDSSDAVARGGVGSGVPPLSAAAAARPRARKADWVIVTEDTAIKNAAGAVAKVLGRVAELGQCCPVFTEKKTERSTAVVSVAVKAITVARGYVCNEATGHELGFVPYLRGEAGPSGMGGSSYGGALGGGDSSEMRGMGGGGPGGAVDPMQRFLAEQQQQQQHFPSTPPPPFQPYHQLQHAAALPMPSTSMGLGGGGQGGPCGGC